MSDENKLSRVRNNVVLTPKARVFIELMSQGVSVPEAYRKAGYKGKDNHAAYSLKALLSQHLRQRLEAMGFSLEGVATEILQLARIPMVTRDQVTLDEKIKILKLFASVLPRQEHKTTAPHVTAFIINRGDKGTTVTAGSDNSIVTTMSTDNIVNDHSDKRI